MARRESGVIRRRGRPAAALAALSLLAALVFAPGAQANPTAAPGVISAAASYLASAENSDGGFGAAPGQGSDPLYTGWAALGLAAAGHNLNRVSHGGGSLMTYLRGPGSSPGDPGSLERTILVLGAAGQPARSFAGRNLVGRLEQRLRRNGSVSGQVNLTAFAVLALRSAGVTGGPVARAQHWLVAQQDRDGGFNFATAGGQSDVDDTGAALEALAGDGSAGGVRARAIAFLRRQQDRDGGFPAQPGSGSNVQSTAWAVQGLEASGASPDSLHRGGAPSPLAYLSSLTAPNGLVRYARGQTQTPVWVTGEALMAMTGRPLPVSAPPPSVPAPGRAARRATRPVPSGPRASARSRRVAAHRTAGSARRRPAPAVASRSASLSRMAGTVGVLTALILAPLGVD